MSNTNGFFTRYISVIVIIIGVLVYLFPQTELFRDLAVLTYGLAWGVGVTGIIIDAFYAEDIRKKYGLSKRYQVLVDLFAHALPIIISTYATPRKTDIPLTSILAFTAVVMVLYMTIINPFKQYPGVPLWLMLVVFPMVTIIAILQRFHGSLR